MPVLNKIRRRLSSAEVQLHDRIRNIRHSGRVIESKRGPLLSFVRDQRAPWLKTTVEPIDMPGMITDEEAQY